MLRWNINASTLLILSMVVLFMLVIVVLPDVDLPDTAFHQQTAPLVVYARATMAPAIVAVAVLFQLPHTVQLWRPAREVEYTACELDPNFRPILLRSIRR
ncbi:MAG TPA: hypothetical protein VMS18_20770 [Candidatus Binatia bacterium]|nr:hypothetical protein [Candidatus Binatia bacterium]